MRTYKEVVTLSKSYDVIFLGVGVCSSESFCKPHCAKFTLVEGPIRSPFTIIKLIFSLAYFRVRYRPISIHVQEEQLLIAAFPALLFSHSVLDIFDSIFLKMNFPGERLSILKRILYCLPKKIIVTDEARYSLLPKHAQKKAEIIPNVPFFCENISTLKKNNSKKIRLGLFGSIQEKRGALFVKQLLDYSSDYECIAAGWLADDFSKRFASSDKVRYLGVLNQERALKRISEDVDFIVSIYPLTNLNNVYASPNKLYDAIHTKTPLIINSGVIVSGKVKELGIGVIVPDDAADISQVDRMLRCSDFQGVFSRKLAEDNSWNQFEDLLISLHAR